MAINHSIIDMPSSPILKGSISHSLCDEIEEKARPFVENIQCNLLNTKRTGWQLFEEEEFVPVFQKFTDRVTETILSFGALCPPLDQQKGSGLQVSCRYTDAWVAWYSSDSFVRPHYHGTGRLFSPEYSLSTYLNVPNEYTELTFQSSNYGGHECYPVEVEKGDFLIFPSFLTHYTNSCEEGRVILSCNFTVTPSYAEEKL